MALYELYCDDCNARMGFAGTAPRPTILCRECGERNEQENALTLRHDNVDDDIDSDDIAAVFADISARRSNKTKE